MRIKIIAIFLLITAIGYSQNSQLAYRYFRKGEYEKAASIYKQLYQKSKVRRDYFKKLLSCYQLTEDFKKADELIQDRINLYPEQSYLNIELGYNLQLQDKKEEAQPYYEKALKAIPEFPFEANQIGSTFKENHLLDYAIKAYSMGMKLSPDANYFPYLAAIYAEQGEIEKMFDAYLSMVEKNDSYYSTVQRYAGRFVTDDNQDNNNVLFRKLLLKRLQTSPNDSWNKLLSWLYMQQRDYGKALIQEKALFRRSGEALVRVLEVGQIAFDNKDYITSKDAFSYILEHASIPEMIIDAELFLLDSDVETATNQVAIDSVEVKFNRLLNKYGTDNATIDLQISYVDFLTFKKNEPQKAIEILENALQKATSELEHGSIKVKLADVLVYTGKFNQALINYTQVQTKVKNSTLAQEARFKVAQTSYFKGDFKWALAQLKVLKGSTSQLIANDAVELHLLISDNLGYDSIPKALQSYAKADLLAFQNKNNQAIDSLNSILNIYKDHTIQDEVLFKQGELFEKTQQFDFAEHNYQKIIELDKEGILVDNAYYKLGQLYETHLNDLEKAKEMYQKIIFEYPSSIYLVDARKRFRKLRGDIIN